MPYRQDVNKLYNQGNGYYKDADGSIYNSQGYRISESQKSINARMQAQAQADQRRANERQMWRDAFNKAGGVNLNPFKGFPLFGFLKLYLGLVVFIAVFMIAGTIFASIFGFVSNAIHVIGNLMKAFFMAWPQTFKFLGYTLQGWNLFKHFGTFWPYIPELALGVLIPLRAWQNVRQMKDDDLFRTEDLWKTALPFLVIEVLHRLTRNPGILRLSLAGALARGAGLGLGLCLVVAIVKKLAYKMSK